MSELSAREIYIANAPRVSRQLMGGHANSGYEFLEDVPGGHPGQDPEAFWVPGNRLDYQTTDNIANLVNPKYSETRDRLAGTGRVIEVVDTIRQGIVEEDINHLVVAPHTHINDIAFGLKVVTDIIEIRNALDGRIDEEPDSGIMINYGVAELGRRLEDGQLIPAVGALVMLCSDIWKFWPHGEEARRKMADLPESIRKSQNGKALTGLNKRLDEGRYIAAGVPHGTTQPYIDASGRKTVAPFGSGLVDIMLRPDVRVLRVGADFSKKEPVIDFTHMPENITDMDEVDNLRHELGSMYAGVDAS